MLSHLPGILFPQMWHMVHSLPSFRFLLTGHLIREDPAATLARVTPYSIFTFLLLLAFLLSLHIVTTPIPLLCSHFLHSTYHSLA